jgi:hypothetical protein
VLRLWSPVKASLLLLGDAGGNPCRCEEGERGNSPVGVRVQESGHRC